MKPSLSLTQEEEEERGIFHRVSIQIQSRNMCKSLCKCCVVFELALCALAVHFCNNNKDTKQVRPLNKSGLYK